MDNRITPPSDDFSPDRLVAMNRLGLSLLFLLAGLTVIVPRFYLDIRATTIMGFFLYSTLAGIYLGLALYLRRREGLAKYWRAAFAFSIFAIATPLANELGRALGGLIFPPERELNSMATITFNQFLTTVLPALAIILLTRISGDDLKSLYLKRGNLRKGLIIGAGTFLAISAFSFSPLGIKSLTHDPSLTFEEILPWIPWIWGSVLLNGFREEIWFRGLFLKKLDAVLGKRLGNLLQASFFALPHFGVDYSSQYFVIILFTFIVGLIMGYLTRKTGSLLAPSLAHAGLDVTVWLAIFATL